MSPDMCPIVVVVGVAQVETLVCKHQLNSVSDLVSKFWYRIQHDLSDLSLLGTSPTHPPEVRPGRDP